MTLLLKSDGDRRDQWFRELASRMPDLEVRSWPDLGDPAEIEFALVWEIPHGVLRRLPNLRAIFSIGAGVDHLFADPELPRQIPICRVVDRNLTVRMTEYVVLNTLRLHRRDPEYLDAQREGRWRELYAPTAAERGVGVMGLGALGGDAARALAALGFRVMGWSRRARDLQGVECFHGGDGLAPFLARADILVCLLPLTPETEGILGANLFARLPRAAGLINAARGGHLIEADLLAALESGQIRHAVLDVFRAEPLPAEHPFWRHRRITITPHTASVTDPSSVAELVAENIRRARSGEPLLHRVDPTTGY